MKDNFVVNIISLNEGLIKIDDVHVIRIKSKDYNLLIMKDYLPIIGMIEGSFDIETTAEKITYDEVIAYYMSNNNIFNIILKDGKHG